MVPMQPIGTAAPRRLFGALALAFFAPSREEESRPDGLNPLRSLRPGVQQHESVCICVHPGPNSFFTLFAWGEQDPRSPAFIRVLLLPTPSVSLLDIGGNGDIHVVISWSRRHKWRPSGR